jgi:oligopeptide transport system ATP-binding protein
MADKLLEVRDLRMHFHSRDGVVKAVDGVSFDLDAGQTLGVVGESGSGKSVTALTVMRLVPMPPGKVEGGDVLFGGRSLLSLTEREMRGIRGNDIAMVFQDPMTSLNPAYRIGRQVAEPLVIHQGVSHREARRRAVELLDLVGIPQAASRIDDYPHQLSGGMRQRVMIAMALACDPAILIADEPTTALDVTIQAQIIELLTELQDRTGTAILMITHDLGIVADIADTIHVMYAGRTAELGATDDVFYEPAHPYTWGLMDSIPRSDADDAEPLRPIKGQPPSLTHVPSGCAFHPRCPYAEEICHHEVPALRSLGGAHVAACHFAGDSGFTRGATARVDVRA